MFHVRERKAAAYQPWAVPIGSFLVVAILALCFGAARAEPEAMVSRSLHNKVVDMHVHTAGIGAGNSGCFVSKELREGYKFSWYLKAFGTSEEELAAHGDAIVLKHISDRLSESSIVSQAVILSLDGVIGADGTLDRERTQTYVPNEFVSRETAKFRNLLFGASINPNRRDALARLRRVKQEGAVLIKWIPAIMDIDPADPAITPFYREMVELDIPLLVHVGQERSFGEANDELGDPVRLELPLSLGVTVIAAHLATTGTNEGVENFDRLIPMFSRFENLYTEISSLTQINKLGYLVQALKVPGLSERMLYGSDWPLQFFPLVSSWYHFRHLDFDAMTRIDEIENQWDRDVALKQALGVPDDVFDRTAKLLKISPLEFSTPIVGQP